MIEMLLVLSLAGPDVLYVPPAAPAPVCIEFCTEGKDTIEN